MVFNANFNNISVLSWRSVLWMEKTTDMPQVTDKLYHTMLYRVYPCLSGIRAHNVSGDKHRLYTCSCKSNYLMITTTTNPYIYIYIYYTSKTICNLDIQFALLAQSIYSTLWRAVFLNEFGYHTVFNNMLTVLFDTFTNNVSFFYLFLFLI